MIRPVRRAGQAAGRYAGPLFILAIGFGLGFTAALALATAP